MTLKFSRKTDFIYFYKLNKEVRNKKFCIGRGKHSAPRTPLSAITQAARIGYIPNLL